MTAEQAPLGLRPRYEALDRLAETRALWVSAATARAHSLILYWGHVTTDTLREACPVPKDVDARVVGTVLRQSNFKADGYQPTGRSSSHHRPITRWVEK